MKTKIGIVDYGIVGNIYNVANAVNVAGGQTLIIKNAEDFKKADKIVLPGVGTFSDAMQYMNSSGLLEPLLDQIKQKDTLGICLGMQILSKIGFEYGETKGLDLIDAEVKEILCDGKIPHMGFNSIDIIKKSPLFNTIENESFYFMHSYEVVNYTDIVSLTSYNNHTFVSSVQKENIFGVQFHPEKSRDAGIKLLNNFIKM